jgi:hypothetical protein
VIQIEQHRALRQNALKVYLRDSSGSELPPIARSSSGCKLLELDRQIPELQRPVTSRKQTAETCSNCQNIQKRLRAISKSSSLLSARDFASLVSGKVVLPTPRNGPRSERSRTATCRSWSKSRRYRKETMELFLPEATTAYKEPASSSNFQISARVPSDELQHHRGAPCSPSQSFNVSRSYGRP